MKSVLLAALLISNFASAELLTLTPSNTKEKGVTIASSAVLNVNAVDYAVASVGYGLRWKKVLGIAFDVYVGQVFASDLTTVTKTDADLLVSVAAQKASAINMNFVSDVENGKIVSSFEAGLQDANGIDLDDADVDAFLTIAEEGGAAVKNKQLIVSFVKNDDGTETLTYANTANSFVKSYTGAAGFAQKVYSAWIGNSSDDGIAAFKADVLKAR